ncbi:MAG TPA: LL-diaminopimelate aminotransferase [Candidatus Gastranaerophilaceae bacterium]|nr:LL-diaminopimelate aminotransferase [Candidatus Gastranaerophilaceae bacterium]HPT41965.1 LL-diaminopimelate aminotransferase [Candidatus Gastranaerophilaceae bacterium]
MKQSARLDKIPPYLFAQIDKKIAEAKAKGIDIISLGIGDPDTPTIPTVVEAMHKAIDNPANHDYPPYNGTKEFRQASVKWMKERFNIELDADKEMLANIGSKEAIAHVFFAFVDEGDYTLIPDPGYPVYKNATILAGGTPYSMPLLEENNFLPDFDKIPEEIAKKSKLMFLNYPNNPTGAICDLEFYKKAVDFCKKYNILLCSDMAYSEMTYDGYVAPSVLQIEGAKDIAIEFFSHSKSYNMTGWRVGFVAGNSEAIKALGTIKNNIDSGVFKAIQQAATKAYEAPKSQIDNLNKMYKERKDIMEKGLKELGWDIKPSKATFYLWLKVPKGYTSEEFVTLMLEKAGVVVPPGTGYGEWGEGYFRIALTKDIQTLKKAFERMKKAGICYNMGAIAK